MNDNYIKSIQSTISKVFRKIYIIDTLNDIVKEYTEKDGKLECIKEDAFTNYYNELVEVIHPDDLNGLIETMDVRTVENKIATDEDLRYKYRKKVSEDEYEWFINIIRVIETEDKRKVTLVLTDKADNTPRKVEKSKREEELEQKEKKIFDNVSDSIIKLNRIININCTSHEPEIKSITEYIGSILSDLSNEFPEISELLSNNMINNANQGEKTILIVDDDQVTCNLIARIFKDQYKVVVCKSGKEAIDLIGKNLDNNTINKKANFIGMFLDLNMPEVTGFEVLDYMSRVNLLTKLPVVIISSDKQEVRDKAYNYPIADVLEKPFNVKIIKHRMNILIKLYKANNSLNEIVLTQHQDIKNVLKLLVKSYLCDCELDIKRTSSAVNLIMRELSNKYPEYKTDDMRIQKITEASKYYNIGLFTLPKKLLTKTDWNSEELAIIKGHPQIGLTIFDSVLYRNTDRIFNHYAKEIILYHEERFDGKGCPNKLKGDEIPIAAQVLSVALEYNYLDSKGESNIIEKIKENSGTKFNPKVVEALISAEEKIKKANLFIQK